MFGTIAIAALIASLCILAYGSRGYGLWVIVAMFVWLWRPVLAAALVVGLAWGSLPWEGLLFTFVMVVAIGKVIEVAITDALGKKRREAQRLAQGDLPDGAADLPAIQRMTDAELSQRPRAELARWQAIAEEMLEHAELGRIARRLLIRLIIHQASPDQYREILAWVLDETQQHDDSFLLIGAIRALNHGEGDTARLLDSACQALVQREGGDRGDAVGQFLRRYGVMLLEARGVDSLRPYALTGTSVYRLLASDVGVQAILSASSDSAGKMLRALGEGKADVDPRVDALLTVVRDNDPAVLQNLSSFPDHIVRGAVDAFLLAAITHDASSLFTDESGQLRPDAAPAVRGLIERLADTGKRWEDRVADGRRWLSDHEAAA